MLVIVVALGLLLALEGLLYAIAPGAMKHFIAMVLTMPDDQIRQSGILAAAIGAVIIFIAARFLRG